MLISFEESLTTLTYKIIILLQHSSGRSRMHKGSSKPHPCVDLILVDIPEGLPIPGISNPADSIPPWNEDSKIWLNPIFEMADQHLQDDGAMILIHPFRVSTKSNLLGYLKSWGYEIKKEWWGMNRLHLTSGINPLLTVSIFIFFIVIEMLSMCRICLAVVLNFLHYVCTRPSDLGYALLYAR